MKLGLWLLIAAVAVLWLNHAKRQRLKQRRPPAQPASATDTVSAAATDTAASEQVVACAHCGLHVPRSDAVIATDGVTVYCSPAHRRLHRPA